jgi:phosphate starvation-inducible PhoH-like protein
MRLSTRPGTQGRTVVEFDDNRHLPHHLGIEAKAHGNKVVLTGTHLSLRIARQVLERAYAQVARGEPMGPGEFDGIIRHTRDEAVAGEGQAHIATRKKTIKARTTAQTAYIRALERTDLVFGIGPAGTGKTYLAVAFAAHLLEKGKVERIILSRPAVEAGERLGFLPGDLKDKVDPYLRPLYDALDDCLDKDIVEKGIAKGRIEIAPLAFMRGRTLTNAAVILDEAQNTTTMQMKMFLTRLGEGSKMFVNGDPTQIDLPPGVKSGLEEALGILSGVKGIEAIRFHNADIVRRDLVQRIVEAYDARK